jgi:uncharacterized protein
MLSCLYQGYVQHRRLTPAKNVFRYGLYMAYLDLDELATLLQGGTGLHQARFSPASFCRTDHVGDSKQALSDAVKDLVQSQTGWRPTGPIRLLTLLRNWGYFFNPLSLYYCFERTGQVVDVIVAEVTNTPWRERHWYVLHGGNRIGDSTQLRFRHPKAFHVSPFMGMDMQYEWHLTPPGAQLTAAIVNTRGGKRQFDVSLALERRELSRWTMLRSLARYPWMTARVTQAIYWQAFRLWRKKCPFYPHPTCSEEQGPAQP